MRSESEESQAPSGALQHGPDGGENLAEIVVQVARDGAEGALLHGDQLLRQFAAAGRKRGHFLKQAPVVIHQVKAGEQDQHQHGRHKQINIALHSSIHAANARSGSLLDFVVLHQQSRDRGAERFLACLQRQADQGASLALPAALGEREDTVERVPKLPQRVAQVLPLFAIAILGRCLRFARKGVLQIRTHPAELPLPGRERIGLAAIQHVAHGQAERVQVVLDAQQEQRIGAIAVDDAALQALQAAKLHHRVARI